MRGEEGLCLIMEIGLLGAEASGCCLRFLQEVNTISKGLLNLCVKIAHKILLEYMDVY